ncbi:hypothetical protein SAMN05421505_10114 [Sinosporangium album]|uniref:Adenylate kinase n=1 Tax=Sinosporangium album TaxID=504805 RepID=A0A1G7QJK0_9ACTN|nr:hypothetical protein [Sinosporangium album]SDF98674.1 hypothetical protein SAMN05421505_10114 [Sinosporangium album]
MSGRRAADVRPPRRIAVLGSPGSGKSTFCHTLAALTGLPLIHLDDVYWGPQWRRTPDAEWANVVERLAAAPHWIIDGNFAGTVRQRVERADVVVLFDRHPWLCAAALVRRSLRLRRDALLGRAPREYVPRGLAGHDPPVRSLTALLRKAAGFRGRELRTMGALLAGASVPVLRCRSRRDQTRVLRLLSAEAPAVSADPFPPGPGVVCACARRRERAGARSRTAPHAGSRRPAAQERNV